LAEVGVGEVDQVLADAFTLKIRVNRHRGKQKNRGFRRGELLP
jgi:hypothetical protein